MDYICGYRTEQGPSYTTGRIKIENGEQFVPMHLATLLPAAPSIDDYLYLTDRSVPTVTRGLFNKLTTPDPLERKVAYQDLAKDLKAQIMSPLVQEYACSYEVGSVFSDSRALLPIFTGESPGVAMFAVYTTQLGLLGINSVGTVATTKVSKYKIGGYTGRKVLYPEILVLVKAKHLTKIRASLLLRSSVFQIPYVDIKVLLTSDNMSNLARTTILPLISPLELKTEYVDQKEMTKYLYKPSALRNNPAEYLEKAREVVNSNLNVSYKV